MHRSICLCNLSVPWFSLKFGNCCSRWAITFAVTMPMMPAAEFDWHTNVARNPSSKSNLMHCTDWRRPLVNRNPLVVQERVIVGILRDLLSLLLVFNS